MCAIPRREIIVCPGRLLRAQELVQVHAANSAGRSGSDVGNVGAGHQARALITPGLD